MAIFGVPVLHEDDPLRAVRAACEMRESLTALNDEFERTWGVRLHGRIGINSGEVMAGDRLPGHLIVTGRAVIVAKRFEEAAAANEILISQATHRLVRNAVVAKRISDRVVNGGETLEGTRSPRCGRTRRDERAASTRPLSIASGSTARCSTPSKASLRAESVIS